MLRVIQHRLMIAAFLVMAAVCLPGEARAQDEGMGGAPEEKAVEEVAPVNDPLQDEFVNLSVQEMVSRQYKLRTPEMQPQQMGSLFFTLWQYSLLQEAKKGFQTRAPTAAEIGKDASETPRTPGIREISLGGIVYAGAKAWTIWLNGQRVTPEAIPEHVIDIQVMKEFIELKWFDTYSNLIYPIRLRPHQRFNLDTRMFLPGEGTL